MKSLAQRRALPSRRTEGPQKKSPTVRSRTPKAGSGAPNRIAFEYDVKSFAAAAAETNPRPRPESALRIHTVACFTQPNSQLPLSAGRDSPGLGKGKTVRIDADLGHSPSWPVPRRPGGEGGQNSASPSQVRAILRYPAASGRRAGRAAPSLAGEDRICFSSTHRSCMVEVSPTLSSSKSGASTCRMPSRHPIWSSMRSAPGKPGLDFIACREHILSGRRGTGKPASRSRVFSPKLINATATPLSPTSRRGHHPLDGHSRPTP